MFIYLIKFYLFIELHHGINFLHSFISLIIPFGKFFIWSKHFAIHVSLIDNILGESIEGPIIH